MKLYKKVNILGEVWLIYYHVKHGEFKNLDGYEGITEPTSRKIYIADFKELIDKDVMHNCESLDSEFKTTLRHELIHAFLLEIGLDENSYDRWGVNEEMIEFFAKNFPKMEKIFNELDAEG